MDKTITIDGKEVKFRATARTPRLYRGIIGRDMITDMNKLRKMYEKLNGEDDQSIEIEGLKIFEDTAYIMALQADPDMKERNADDWLDTFEMFSIYEILPQIIELWALNTKQTSTPKKK